MEIKYINEFRVLAEVCNFQEAAEQLYISLSTLSKHVSKMEEELGVPLFDRTTRRVALTEYGKVFYTYAIQLTNNYNDCLAALQELSEDESRRLSVAFPPPLTEYDLPIILGDFMRAYPEIQVSITEHNNPLDLLQSKKCDIAFHTEYNTCSATDQALMKYSDELVVVVPASHALAQKDSVTMPELAEERFVIKNEPSSPLSRIMRKLCLEAGFEPQVACAVRYSSAMPKMVNMYDAVAITNRRHVPTGSEYNIKVLEITPTVPFYVSLYFAGEKKSSIAVQSFRRYFSDVLGYKKL